MKRTVACKRLLASLSDYVDGELDESLCSELEKHLSECDNCRVVVDTLRKTVELYHDTTPDVQVPDDVQARLYHCLDLEEYLKK